jgi:hypothetical protein
MKKRLRLKIFTSFAVSTLAPVWRRYSSWRRSGVHWKLSE